MSKVDKKKSLRKIKQFFKKTLKGKQIEEGDRFLKSLEEDFSKSPRQLAINTLGLSDVMDIFDLTEDPNSEQVWALSNEELLEIPNSLYKTLESTGRALGRDPQNEEACRWRINDIMKDVIIQEQIHNCTHSTMSAVFFAPETYLARTVIFKDEERLLNGKADYTTWYGNGAMDTMMVVLEAKRNGLASDGIAQCLAYMAIVAEIRKDKGHKNAVIYGCATDGHHFSFLRIDTRHQFSIWHQNWGLRTMSYLHRSERRIYTHLRMMTRMATLSSPRTSVLKVRRFHDKPNDGRSYYQRFASDEEMT